MIKQYMLVSLLLIIIILINNIFRDRMLLELCIDKEKYKIISDNCYEV